MQQEMSRDIDKSFNEALQIGMHKLTAIISFLELEPPLVFTKEKTLA